MHVSILTLDSDSGSCFVFTFYGQIVLAIFAFLTGCTYASSRETTARNDDYPSVFQFLRTYALYERDRRFAIIVAPILIGLSSVAVVS